MRFLWLTALYYDLCFLRNHYLWDFSFGITPGRQHVQYLKAGVVFPRAVTVDL